MDAKRPNVRAGLAGDPENTEVAVIIELDKLGFVDGSDTELALDGRNQRRTLEQGTRQS